MTADGQLERIEHRSRLHFVRELAHPPERVWRAITEPEHLAVWFPQDIVGERVAGAPLRFVSRDDEPFEFAGEMVVVDAPHVLEFLWGDDRLRFELEATPAGTRLTLTDTFTEHGKAARDGAGWHECLDRLADVLDGRAPRWGWGERWAEVHDEYVTRFGPDAATVGPPG
ncbi:MAG: hypothetical protein QOE08_1264 [Thermoleophilaceae bacterium]|nr:hypothetical protein [Thermoleophilaceae bacterium]